MTRFITALALVMVLTPALEAAPVAPQTPAQTAPTVDTLPAIGHAERPRTIPPPAAPAPQGDVSVRTTVDRTALWVADRLTYTIEVSCRRGHDILTDDLSREKLPLTGLEVVSTDAVRRTDGADATHYAFRYVLTTYRVDAPSLKIGPLALRYYVSRAGQRPDEAAPAGTVQVPATAVAFRSLLPDDQPSYDVRDRRSPDARLLRYRVLRPVGLGLILVSTAPVAFIAIAFARRTSQEGRSARRSLRHARQAVSTSLEAVRAADPATADDRRDAFTRLDALVRQHLSAAFGVPAASMTPAEIVAALGARATELPVELASSVLKTCELARYAPPALLPSTADWRDTLAHAEQVLAAKR
jgi:hypothetical protein